MAHVSRFVPEMGTLVLPYLWKDTDTMFAALDGRMGQTLEPLLLDKGFKVAGWWDNGFRHVSNSKRPIRTPEDLRGLKLRTLPTKVHVAFFRALGVSPDARWTGPRCIPPSSRASSTGRRTRRASCTSRSWPEVQKYYSLTEHVNEPGRPAHEPRPSSPSCPADLQTAIMTAAKQAAALAARGESEGQRRDAQEARRPPACR